MAFHVEISDRSNHARIFNLGPQRLREEILLPFLAGRSFELGDQQWQPHECDILVFEGPELDGPQIAFGRGWGNAQKSGRNVTRAALDTVRASLAQVGVTVLASEAQDESYVGAALERLGKPTVPWASVLERLLGGHRDDIVVVVAIGDAPPGTDWWFGTGVAIGALGDRVLVVVTADREPPAALAGFPAVRLDVGDAGFAQALSTLGASAAAAQLRAEE